MKIKKYMNWLAGAALLLAGVTMTSCEDQPDKFESTGGVPEIQYIRPSALAQSDSLITEAYTEATICLVGNNLRSIKQMWFNDQKVILNTSFMTDHTMIVDVPGGIPAEVNDLITMVTADGQTVTYPFHVIIPGPTLATMSYEYAPVGSTVTITGDYFVDDPNVPLEVFFPGNIAANIKNFDKNNIVVTVPEGATEEGAITVKTIYGEGESTFHYLESRGILFDFDGLTGLGNHGWHARDILTDETAVTGNFVQLGNGDAKMSEDGGWDDNSFSFEYWPGSWNTPIDYPERDGIRLFDLVDFSKAEKMALKFDMYIPKNNPWMAGAMQIVFAGTDKVTLSGGTDIFGNEVPGANNTYFHSDDFVLPRALYRPWTSTGSFDTGDEWITVTLPIASSFVYNYDGSAVNYTLKETDFASLLMFVWGGGINGTECQPIIKIDNIRVVPN